MLPIPTQGQLTHFTAEMPTTMSMETCREMATYMQALLDFDPLEQNLEKDLYRSHNHDLEQRRHNPSTPPAEASWYRREHRRRHVPFKANLTRDKLQRSQKTAEMVYQGSGAAFDDLVEHCRTWRPEDVEIATELASRLVELKMKAQIRLAMANMRLDSNDEAQ